MKRKRDKENKSEPSPKRRKEVTAHPTKTPMTVLSLPQELRQQILLAVYDDDRNQPFGLQHTIQYYIPKIKAALQVDSTLKGSFEDVPSWTG